MKLVVWMLSLCTLVGVAGFDLFRDELMDVATPWVICADHRSQAATDAILYFSGDAISDKKINPISRRRLDHVIGLYQSGQWVIINGHGKARFPIVPQARQYLVDNGIPNQKILSEDKSTNTWENLQEAIRFIREKEIHTVTFVSSPYHLDRILRYYQKQKLLLPELETYPLEVYWSSYSHHLDDQDLAFKSVQVFHELISSPRDFLLFGNSLRSGLCY